MEDLHGSQRAEEHGLEGLITTFALLETFVKIQPEPQGSRWPRGFFCCVFAGVAGGPRTLLSPHVHLLLRRVHKEPTQKVKQRTGVEVLALTQPNGYSALAQRL